MIRGASRGFFFASTHLYQTTDSSDFSDGRRTPLLFLEDKKDNKYYGIRIAFFCRRILRIKRMVYAHFFH